jgi:hypothetical protein
MGDIVGKELKEHCTSSDFQNDVYSYVVINPDHEYTRKFKRA